MFNAPVFTAAGKELLTRNIAGEQIKFTSMQMGSGYITDSIDSMTALISVEATVYVNAKNEGDQYVNVSAAFSNQELTHGFYWREIGIFAANPSFPNDRSKDILYCYQNAYDTAEFIPDSSSATIEKEISVPIIVGDAVKVSAIIDKTIIYATQRDLEDHNKDLEAHSNRMGVPGGFATLNTEGILSEEQRWSIDAYAKKEVDHLISAAIDEHNSSEDSHDDIRTRIVAMNATIDTIELRISANVKKNPFSATFANLDGVVVNGVWNEPLARIEF